MKLSRPHKNLLVAEGRDLEDRKAKGVKSRPEEEDQNDDHLGGDQEIREEGIFERCFFSSTGKKGNK